jgi:hypothetical protein
MSKDCWRRDKNPLVSLERILEEHADEVFHHQRHDPAHDKGIVVGICMREPMRLLKERFDGSHLHMDATFGMQNP